MAGHGSVLRAHTVWYCDHCQFGPLDISIYASCLNCGHLICRYCSIDPIGLRSEYGVNDNISTDCDLGATLTRVDPSSSTTQGKRTAGQSYYSDEGGDDGNDAVSKSPGTYKTPSTSRRLRRRVDDHSSEQPNSGESSSGQTTPQQRPMENSDEEQLPDATTERGHISSQVSVPPEASSPTSSSQNIKLPDPIHDQTMPAPGYQVQRHNIERGLPNIRRQKRYISSAILDADADESDLESILSEAPSLASSQSSAPNSIDNSTIDELKYMLLTNETLEPLFDVALSRAGPDRFQRNFRRLLLCYSRALKKEAITALQMKAARFVRFAALRVSIQIKDHIENEGRRNERKGKSRDKLLAYLTQDLPSSDDESDDDPEEAALQTLEEVKNFMISSAAFSTLNSSFRAWLKMNDQQGMQSGAVRAPEIIEISSSIDGSSSRSGNEVPAIHQLPPHRLSNLRAIWKRCSNTVSDLLQKEVPAGQIRISWTCRCGGRLRLQVPESHEKAAIAFATQAAGANTNTITSQRPGRRHTSASSSNRASSSTEAATPRATSSRLHSPDTSPSEDGSHPVPPFIPSGTKKFLLLCVNTTSPLGLHQRRLVNVDITNVDCGGEMFQRLHNAYYALKKTSIWNPFVVPKTMHYIKFQLLFLQKSGEVVGNYQTNSIPSVHEVMKQEYAFRPCPPQLGDLPMPPHIFMHTFLNPGDHLGPVAVEILPKKLWAKLRWNGQVNDHFNIPTGWGFFIVDGIREDLVWLLAVLLLVSVTVLTITWSALMDDVQGATGLGQYCLAVLAVLGSVFLWQYSTRKAS